MNVKLKPFHPYIRLAMYHTWLYDYVADRSIYDNEIIYIDKGKLSLFIDGKTYILKEGDVAIIPPNVYHKITWYEENCCQPHVHFDFDKDEFSSIIPVSMHNTALLFDLPIFFLCSSDFGTPFRCSLNFFFVSSEYIMPI